MLQHGSTLKWLYPVKEASDKNKQTKHLIWFHVYEMSRKAIPQTHRVDKWLFSAGGSVVVRGGSW